MNPAITLYRLGNFLFRLRLPLIPKIITYINRFLFSVYLPSSASIGKNFKLGYLGLGVVIHDKAIIGDNCLIAQNVTIGRNLKDKNVPILGNNVYVGTGTVIFGDIKIGNNVIIGANSVVNKTIIKNTTVAGNPLKILSSNTKLTYMEIDVKNIL
jgi:serine O-acetyltransferase